MDLRALRYFVEVVRQKGFTRAAQILNITQPTLSKMVRQLEEDLQSELLVRGTREVWPTDAGRILYDRGTTILQQVNSAKEDIANIKGLTRGELRLGVTPMIGSALFIGVMRRFRERYPGITLTVVECGSKIMATAITNGQVEIGTMVGPIDPNLLEYRPFFSDEVALAVPVESRWAQCNEVALSELAGENFLLPTDDFTLPDIIRSACREAGFFPVEVGHSAQWDLLRTMVEIGMGVAPLPAQVCRLFDRQRIATVRLSRPKIALDLSFAWRRGGRPSSAALAWIDVTIETLSAL